MTLKMTSIMMIVSCLAIPFNSSILKVGALLLLMALLSTMIISSVLGSWFGFITFLIYITGLLVLFGYLLAVSPNSFQKNNYSLLNLPSASVLLISVTTALITVTNTNMSSTSSKSNFSLEVVKIFSGYNLGVYWLMGILLFIALIMAVLLSYKSPKPLRPYIK